MAKRFKAKYDTGDVLAMYRQKLSNEDEMRLRNTTELLRTYCNLEHAVHIPAEYRAITREIRTPYLRDAWSRIAASLVSKPPVVQVTPKDENRREYRDASADASRFFAAMMTRLSKQTGSDAIYDSTSALVRDGESVLKLVHIPNAWGNFPASTGAPDEDMGKVLKSQEDYKKSQDLPFAWRVVDRLSCVFGDGEFGDDWAIEYGEYPMAYAKGKYGFSIGEDGRLYDPKRVTGGMPHSEGMGAGPGRFVKVEFWDKDEWHVICDGTPAPNWPKANPYSPYIPLFRAKGHQSESLLYSLMYLVPRLDELLTMKLNWAFLGSYPNPVIETVPTQQS